MIQEIILTRGLGSLLTIKSTYVRRRPDIPAGRSEEQVVSRYIFRCMGEAAERALIAAAVLVLAASGFELWYVR